MIDNSLTAPSFFDRSGLAREIPHCSRVAANAMNTSDTGQRTRFAGVLGYGTVWGTA